MLSALEHMMKMTHPWYSGGTYIIDRDSHEQKGISQQAYVDLLCLSYLSDAIDSTSLVPFQSDGDGNCLLHAVCKAVCGADHTHMELRERMTQELVENELWYRFHLHLSEEEWAKSLEMAQGDGNYLGSEHIFALSNHLQRPIILLDNRDQISSFGEGEGGVTATFLPTRFPIAPVMAPPLMIAWASSEHRHYVPIVPALKHNDTYPRLKLPQVAYSWTLPPGTEPGDYFHYRVAGQHVQCMVDLSVRGKPHSILATVTCGQDLVETALMLVRRFSLGRERIVAISSFFKEVAIAHTIPVTVSDASHRVVKELNRCGVFPTSNLSLPPASNFISLAGMMRTQLSDFEGLKDEQRTSIEALLEIVPNGGNAPLDLSQFQVLVDLLPKFPKPAIALGFLHSIMTNLSVELFYPVIKNCRLVPTLLSLVNKDTPVGVMVAVLRLASTLLNAKDYGMYAFPLIHHQELRSQVRTLITSLPPIHFPSLASFLHNYASFISYTQLFTQRVRLAHMRHLIAFVHSAQGHYASHPSKADLQRSIEDSLHAIGNITITQPENTLEFQEMLTPLLKLLQPLPISLSLISDLNALLSRRPEAINIPRASSLLSD